METLTSYHAQKQISDKLKTTFKINQTNVRKNVGRYDYDSDAGESLLRKIQNAKATKEKMKGNNIYKVLIYTSPVLDVLYTLTLTLLRAL